MSLTFSRRSFLKYTAVAAVAVAGSSLLTGCKDNDNTATRTKLGAITVLQGQTDLTSVKYTDGKLVFDFTIKNNRTNPFEISRDHFCVMVTDENDKNTYYAYKNSGDKLVLETDLSEPTLQNKGTATCTITANGVPALASTDTVTLIYYPDHQYIQYAARWNLLVSDGEVTLPTSSEE